MNELIEELLTMARADDPEIPRETVQLNEIADACWENVHTDRATLVCDTHMSVSGAPSQLRQVLENLFRNAVEHGGADVTVRVGALEDGAGFYVEDDGPGIPEADRERVFEPGYTTKGGGTGIGLPSIQQIALAHGWTVRITEGTDGGARFEFTNVVRPA